MRTYGWIMVALFAGAGLAAAAGDDVFAAFQATSQGATAQPPRAASIPCGPEAFTWKKYHEQEADWFLRTTLTNYDRYGSHSEKWDDTARAFLRSYAPFRRSNRDRDTTNALLRLSAELQAKGCDDPMLLYFRGNVISQLVDQKEAEPIIRRALAMLEGSRYPRMNLFYAARRLENICRSLHRGSQEIATLNRRKMQYLGQAAADADFAGGNQRYYMEECRNEFSGESSSLPPDVDTLVAEIDRNPQADPWIQGVVMGMVHIGRAWKSRGGGYADTVTAEGWKAFGREMDLSRQALTGAHGLHPEFPEAATELITVSMATDSTRMRYWFNRAVAAHFDYLPAYQKLRFGMYPRWHGSLGDLQRFAVECLETKRFDTLVPWEFLGTFNAIGSELPDWHAAYQQPGTMRRLRTLFTGYEAVKPQNAMYYRSTHVLLARIAGEYDLAALLLDSLSNQLDRAAADLYHCTPGDVVADVRLRTGPAGETFMRAEERFAASQPVLLLSFYRGLAREATNQPQAVLNFLADRVSQLEARQQFLNGAWLHLRPEPDLRGWQIRKGDWQVADDGTLSGTSEQTGLLLRYQMCTGTRYEITGLVESEHQAGVALGGSDHNAHYIFLEISPSRNTVKLTDNNGWEVRAKPATDLARRNRFTLAVRGRRCTATVNGEELFTNQELPAEYVADDTGRFCLGGDYGVAGHTIRYREVKLRQLPREDDNPAAGKLPQEVELALRSGDTCRLAAVHYELDDIPDAETLQMFQQCADAGDARGVLWLARLSFKGRCGLPANPAEAQQEARGVITNVARLAEAGNREAQFLLGSACQEGLGLEMDLKRAAALYERAAAAGHITARNNLGVMLKSGHGTRPDIARARRLFAQAAEQGSAMAASNLRAVQPDSRDETARRKELSQSALVQALGRQREEGIAFLVERGLIADAKKCVESVSPERTELYFREDGLLLAVDLSGRIVDVEGYAAGGRTGCGAFRDNAPLGVTWSDTAATAREKLGAPDDSGGVPSDGAYGMAYRLDNVFYAVMFSYEDKRTLKVWRVYERWAADYPAPPANAPSSQPRAAERAPKQEK